MRKNKQLKLLLLASYLNNLGWGIYAPISALYVLKLGGTSFDVSLLWSVYAMITGLLMVIFGRLENSAKYNPAKMLVIGYGLFVIVAVVYLNASTVQHLYIAGVVMALAMGIMTPAAKITYARAQKRGKEAGEWGIFDGGNYMLIAVAAFLGGYVFKYAGFSGLFTCMIFIQTAATVAALKYARLRN